MLQYSTDTYHDTPPTTPQRLVATPPRPTPAPQAWLVRACRALAQHWGGRLRIERAA